MPAEVEAEACPALPVEPVLIQTDQKQPADQDGKLLTMDDEHYKLPAELAFLEGHACNPDLGDPIVRKIGNMRNADGAELRVTQYGILMCMQKLVSYLVYSWPFQVVVFFIILFDLLMTFLTLSRVVDDEGKFSIVGDVVIVIVLTLDVLLRFFAEGRKFVRSCLNLFELVLVPITITEITLLQDANLPVPLLRAIRPVLRGCRVLRILIKTAGKGKAYFTYLRHQVSGDRIRFVQDGFDLDLAYIAPQLIAMSVPAVGGDSLLRNPCMEVARFMNERHGNRYLIVNTMPECQYPMRPFFERYLHFPILQDGVPRLDDLFHLCEVLDSYLSAHPENLVAIHSRNGQGRTALVMLALLLYRSDHPTVASATAYFEHNRVDPSRRDVANTQTIDSMSQGRFLEYFSYYVVNKDKVNLEKRPAKLKRIQLLSIPKPENININVHVHPRGSNSMWNKDRQASKLHISNEEALVALEEEEEKEEEEFEKEMTKDSGNLLTRVQGILEEGTIDSFRSGGQEIKAKPLITSNTQASANLVVQTPSALGQTDNPLDCVWEFKDVELSDEIRFEIHRTVSNKGEEEKTSFFTRLFQIFCCCFLNDSDRNAGRFQGGMIFSCWLHMGWLEHDEQADGPSSQTRRASSSCRHSNSGAKRQGNTICINFDRNTLDKASFAPPMRTHSAALKMVFEFEVDHRVELRPAGESSDTWGLLNSASGSQPESLKWLTWVGQKIWPSFTSGFQKLISDGLEGARPNLPGPLKKMQLSHCSFGDAYPEFGPISACSRDHEGLEVQLDIGLKYQTETSIVLDTGFASFGISELKILGLLSLKFKPILPELPVLAALQLLFLNPPTIELRFTNALEIANSSFAQNLITSQISKALSDVLVLPNIMNINWGDPNCDGTLSFISLMPVHVARVSVVAARSLRTISSLFNHRPPDTYVSITISSHTAKTRVIAKTGDPVWEEDFDFVVYDARQHITIEVFDVDFASRKQSIGKSPSLPVADVSGAGIDGRWIQLKKCPNDAPSEILIRIMLQDLHVNPTRIQNYISEARQTPASATEICANFESCENEEVIDTELDEKEDEDLVVPSIDTVIESHAGAVAVLIIHVIGGICPQKLGSPSALVMHAQIGSKAKDKALCKEAAKLELGSLSEKVQQSIERFSGMGLSSAQIADALGEDPQDVERMIRKRGWNIEIPQKMNLLLHPSDLAGAQHLHLSIVQKVKTIASGKVAIGKIVSQSQSAKYQEIVQLPCTKGGGALALDMEFRLYVLAPVTTATDDPL